MDVFQNVCLLLFIGVGLGWYTLFSMILVNYFMEFSAIAFLTNIFNSFYYYFYNCKEDWFFEPITPCGVTAIDTSLTIIARFTNSKTDIIAFITSVILFLMVPILVPIMIKI